MHGIDISEHQGWAFDIAQHPHDFVIIRAGWGLGNEDKLFRRFADQAEALGVPYGVYWYSYATSPDRGADEARSCLEVIRGRNIRCGVWIDMEDADKYKRDRGALTPAVCTGVCKQFCDVIQAAGYHAGIYASRSWFGPRGVITNTYGYDKWVAAWGANDGRETYDLSGECSVFQYRGSPLDLDRMYVPLSWFCDDVPAPARKTIHQLAEEVIQGLWGNGSQREDALTLAGYSYREVQAEVNRILSDYEAPMTDLTALAWDVIAGKYGNGLIRRAKLGSKYDAVQAEVNRLLSGR